MSRIVHVYEMMLFVEQVSSDRPHANSLSPPVLTATLWGSCCDSHFTEWENQTPDKVRSMPTTAQGRTHACLIQTPSS